MSAQVSEFPTIPHECQKMRQVHPERSSDDSHETGKSLFHVVETFCTKYLTCSVSI